MPRRGNWVIIFIFIVLSRRCLSVETQFRIDKYAFRRCDAIYSPYFADMAPTLAAAEPTRCLSGDLFFLFDV